LLYLLGSTLGACKIVIGTLVFVLVGSSFVVRIGWIGDGGDDSGDNVILLTINSNDGDDGDSDDFNDGTCDG